MVRAGDLFVARKTLVYSGTPRDLERHILEAGSIILVLDEPYLYFKNDREVRIVEVLTCGGKGFMLASHFDLIPDSTRRVSK